MVCAKSKVQGGLLLLCTVGVLYLHVGQHSLDGTWLYNNVNYDAPYTIKFAERDPYFIGVYEQPWNTAEMCAEESTKLIIMINSHPSEYDQRQAIRNTWLNNYHVNVTDETTVPLTYTFVIGEPDTQSDRHALVAENAINGDLILTNITEHYFHLPVKIGFMFVWKMHNCEQVPWLFKTDTDVIVLTDNLLRVTDIKNDQTYQMFCHVWRNALPFRDRSDLKLYVPKQVWPDNKAFPNYCSGNGYLMTQVAVKALVQYIPYKPWPSQWPRNTHEDVTYTGIIAQMAGVRRTGMSVFTHNRDSYVNTCPLNGTVNVHGYKDAPAIYQQWNTWKKLECYGFT